MGNERVMRIMPDRLILPCARLLAVPKSVTKKIFGRYQYPGRRNWKTGRSIGPAAARATLLLALAVLLAACAPRTPPDGRLSLPEAEALVRAWIFDQQPAMNPRTEFPLEEITPDRAWEELRVQVFKVREGLKMYESYLVRDGRIYPLGTAFGGVGVNSMRLTDLDENGTPELAFTYSFGSGIHQSSVGIAYEADGVWTVLLAEYRFPGDLLLVEADGGGTALVNRQDGSHVGLLSLSDSQLVVIPE